MLRPPVEMVLARDDVDLPWSDGAWIYQPKLDFCARFALLLVTGNSRPAGWAG